jgi:hypothetical protein
MPRQPKRTETLEQARENAPASMAPAGCCLTTAASSSNDAAIRRSGFSASLDPIAAKTASVGGKLRKDGVVFFSFLREKCSARFLCVPYPFGASTLEVDDGNIFYVSVFFVCSCNVSTNKHYEKFKKNHTYFFNYTALIYKISSSYS